jgi:hypothetical protein
MPTCAHQADGHCLKSKRCGVLRVGPSWVCIGTVHAGCLKRLGCDFGSRSCLGRLPLHWVRPPSGCCSIAVTWLWPLPWLGCGGALSMSRWLAKLLLGCGFCCDPATSQDTSSRSPHPDHLIPITSSRSPHPDHLIPITSSRSPHPDHLIPITSSRSPHPDHLIPITSSRSPHRHLPAASRFQRTSAVPHPSLYASIPMLLCVLLMPLLTPHCSHLGGGVTAR